jgi:para-nitrobenzyl esterase
LQAALTAKSEPDFRRLTVSPAPTAHVRTIPSIPFSKTRRALEYALVLTVITGVGCEWRTAAEPEEATPRQSDPAPASLQSRELAAQSGTLIQLAEGRVQGHTESDTRSFIGIPYAAPPLGDLRWKPPQPVREWSDTLEATGPGVACVQPGELLGPVTQTEDCLRLNVFAPASLPDKPVPVLVWLHGGGNSRSSANAFIERPVLLGTSRPAARLYDGAAFRTYADRDVIVVTVNYRLGALGFLSHPGLTNEEGASGNYGLMDQQAALRWVKRHIGVFGGDPERITLFGQAAGAIDSCYQLVANDAAGLFHAAILESGTCASAKLPELPDAEIEGKLFAAARGCGGKDDAASVTCLRAQPAADLVRSLRSEYADPDHAALAIVDGAFITEQPRTALQAGRFQRVPTIVGNTAREASLFFEGERAIQNETQYRQMLDRMLDPRTAEAAAMNYRVTEFATPNDAAIALLTDALFACPARRFAETLSSQAPVFLYSFDRSAPIDPFDGLGATHGVDLLWVWNTWPALSPYSADEVEFSRKVRGYWSRLVDGDVNVEGASRAYWPRYERGDESELAISEKFESAKGLRRDRCMFWDALPGSALATSEILARSDSTRF